MGFDFGSVVGGALGGVASVIGGIHSDKTQRSIARQQTNANIDMMREMNEYNKPINQMKRLKEAGLNPNLMYGSISPGNQSTPIQAVAPNIQGKGSIYAKAVQDAMETGLKLDMASKKYEVENKKLANDSLRIDNQFKIAEMGLALQDLHFEKRLDFDKTRQDILNDQFNKRYVLDSEKLKFQKNSFKTSTIQKQNNFNTLLESNESKQNKGIFASIAEKVLSIGLKALLGGM